MSPVSQDREKDPVFTRSLVGLIPDKSKQSVDPHCFHPFDGKPVSGLVLITQPFEKVCILVLVIT